MHMVLFTLYLLSPQEHAIPPMSYDENLGELHVFTLEGLGKL
jgi:hypothetical protein